MYVNFRIADTFTDSLAKLNGEEQKSVKTTAFDLQLNPANPGMQFHKLDRAKDPNFWSVRVPSGAVRGIPSAAESGLSDCRSMKLLSSRGVNEAKEDGCRDTTSLEIFMGTTEHWRPCWASLVI